MSSFLSHILGSIAKVLSNEQTLEAEVLQDIALGTAAYQSFAAGEAVQIASFTENGSKVLVVAVKEGGAAATSLGV